MHVRTGDQVLVLAGKDRGKKGKVLQVYPNKQRVLVEGVNLVKKAMRPTEDNPEGGISEREAALHASNVKVIEARKEAE
ncbi:MAG: 50S ribosomal protein L24 [Verrucomicrobia bacterium]|nr:50S ribosomal protein L24 [Verrucomicrobiota bacterium]